MFFFHIREVMSHNSVKVRYSEEAVINTKKIEVC